MRTRDLRTVEEERAAFHGLTVTEVAGRLGCDRSHVLRLIGDRQLAAVNIARGKRPNYRIHKGELERFLKARAA